MHNPKCGERLQQPFKADYNQALGSAASCFAICEWNAVNCAEKIKAGTIHKITNEKMTAGQISKLLINLARCMPPSKDRKEMQLAAERFDELIELRNNIFHGKPCSNANGEARLSGHEIFEISVLEHAADSFSACSSELNRILHGFLKSYIAHENS